jgi:hypothetical protein
VDKIVILTRHAEADDRLIPCLAMLFPECEIQIRSSRVEGFGAASLAPARPSTDKGEKKNGKTRNLP